MRSIKCTGVSLCVEDTLARPPGSWTPTKFHRGTSEMTTVSEGDSRRYFKTIFDSNELRVTGIISSHRVNHFDGAFPQGVIRKQGFIE